MQPYFYRLTWICYAVIIVTWIASINMLFFVFFFDMGL